MDYYKATERYLYDYGSIDNYIRAVALQIEEVELDNSSVRGINYTEELRNTQRKSKVECEILIKEQKIEELEIEKNKLINKKLRIKNALELLSDDELNIIRKIYFNNNKKTLDRIANELHVNTKTLTNKRRSIINKLSPLLFKIGGKYGI